jgi:hypothetical protein
MVGEIACGERQARPTKLMESTAVGRYDRLLRLSRVSP